MFRHGKHEKGRKNANNSFKIGAQGKEVLEKIDENNLILKSFKKYSLELDEKHDKCERIIKLSRDISIESKRIIFLLHSAVSDSKKISVLKEADTRLDTLINCKWRQVAKELQNKDHYLFHRAFSPGMQEFLEAFIFFNYLKEEKFLPWSFYEDKLKFKGVEKSDENGDLVESEVETVVKVVPTDYILGLADATGELMRKCINSLGEGNVEECFKTCNFVRNLYSGFLTVGLIHNKELFHKMYTLKNSLLKMETVCYNIHVRGSEVPKHMLADVEVQKSYNEEDEGFFG